MSKSNAVETDILAYIFTGTAIPWAAATQLDIHLHTGDPGEGGDSTTSECDYDGYAAVVAERNASDWTVSGNTVTNDLLIQFPICEGGSDTATHVSVTPHGSTTILYSGALNDPLNISTGIQPQFPASELAISED